MSAVMTPRERVLAAVQQQKPDRIPRDFWAEPPAMKRLLDHVGTTDTDRLLDALGVDIRHLDAPGPAPREITPGLWRNAWGEQYVHQGTLWGPMREDVPGALAGAEAFTDLESFAWPTPDGIDRSTLRAQCTRYQDHALLYGFADIWQRPALVRGWQGMFLDMVERPAWVHFLARTFTDFYLEDYTRAAEITGGRIDLYLLISDLGSQRGPLISPRMFHDFVAPYVKEMIDCIHGLGGLALFHSCGAMAPFIPELIQLGVDVLDPIQAVDPTMQPDALRQAFGGEVCFHGGIDMQDLLPRGTPDQVTAEAHRYGDILGQNGGYILAPGHLFQPDVPPENILAMYR